MAVQISGNDITVPRDGSFTRNVTIGGTLTYEDVTNIDSVGLVTARTGIEIGARPGVAASISVDGNMIVSGISTFNGDVKLDGGNLVLGDSGGGSDDRLVFGAGSDLAIYHDGSHSILEETGTGALKIKGDDIRIENTSSRNVFKAVGTACELYFDSGSGTSKKFETISTGVVITGSDDGDGGAKGDFKFFQTDGTLKIMFDASTSQFEFLDNSKASFGSDDDLKIYHDGNSRIQNTNNSCDFRIQSDSVEIKANSVDEYMIKGTVNGAVELYHNNEKKLYTYTDGVFVQDDSSAGAYLVIATNAGTQGSLYGTSNTLGFLDGQNHYMLKGVKDGALELYYNGNKTCETTSAGFKVIDGAGSQAELRVTATGTNRADIMSLATGTGDANLWLDASDGDLSGADYAVIRHLNSNLDLEIINYANDVYIKTRNGSLGSGGVNTAIHCEENGKVILYYDGNMRAQTTTWGFQVEGDLLPQGDNQHKLGESNERWSVLYAANGSINTSDRNEKNTIVESDLGLDFINKLNPVSYKWNKDDGKTHYGLIAQDVEETLTSIGKTVSDFGGIHKEDNSPMGLGYSELISPLIKAVQELSVENAALKARLDAAGL